MSAAISGEELEKMVDGSNEYLEYCHSVIVSLYWGCTKIFGLSKKSKFQKVLIFSTRGFFDMGNSNLKEFVDFNHRKIPQNDGYIQIS
jgi:hypothetical protein